MAGKTKTLLLLLFAGFIFNTSLALAQSSFWCSKNRFTDQAVFDSSDIRIDSDVVYGIAKNFFSGINDTLRMNIYYPDTAADTLSSRPFILLIHGGSFIGGNLHDMDYQCMSFARRGFVTATISYRLGWNCGGTDFLSICLLCGGLSPNLRTATYEAAQDGRAAMRYIDANRSLYKIDNSNYFIGGTSAGSITALHTVFWNQQEANDFCQGCTNQVGLLDTSGNALPSAYQFRGVIDNCGGISKDSAMLNNGNIPMISFHDEGDCIVPNQYGQVISCACQSFYWVAGSSAMHAFLDANSICTSMNLVPLSVSHCSFPEYELVDRASCFIKSILCDSCQSGFNNTPYVPLNCSSSIGIQENNSFSHVMVFPNPADELLQFTGCDPDRSYGVLLYDVSGKVIAEEKFHGEKTHQVMVDNVSEGLYFIKITSGQEIRMKKILIIKSE